MLNKKKRGQQYNFSFLFFFSITSMSWQDLPVEIQIIIFQHLKQCQVQLSQCQLTCKGWFVTAQRELYTNVHVKRSKLDTFAQSVSNESALYRNYVNTIQLDDSDKGEQKNEIVKGEQRKHKATSLFKIAQYCPNTERFIMKPLDRTPPFRRALKQIGIAGLGNRIKELPNDEIELLDQYPPYTQIVPLFAKSLETIYFSMCEYDRRKTQATLKKLTIQKFDSIADYLQHFQRLKKVSIYLGNRPIINLQSMDEFFDQVPATVTFIKFESAKDTDCSLEEDKSMQNILPIKKNDYLKSFQATLPILNANTLEYALAKFPQLSKLKLTRAHRHNTGNALLFDMPKTLLNQIMELDKFELNNLTIRNYTVIFDTPIKEGNTAKELTLTRYLRNSRTEVKFYLDIEKYWKNGASVVSILAKSNQSNREALPQNIQMFWEMELLEKYGAFLKKLTICNLAYDRNWIIHVVW